MKKQQHSPLVSIGLIAYNKAHTLPASLDSLREQRYSPIEIIISDDASTDDTPIIGTRYANQYPNIRFYRQKKNIGIARNSNFVLKKARGSYFMWATDEDLWHKDYIAQLVTLLQTHPRAALAVSNMRLFRPGYEQVSDLPFPRYAEGISLIKLYLQHPALLVWGLFCTDVLRDAGGFHENRRYFFGGSDFVTVLRVLLKRGLATTSRILFCKRDSGNALNRFEILKTRQFTPDVVKRIKRYLVYPYMFSMDLYYVVQSFRASSFSYRDKAVLLCASLKWYARVLSEMVTETTKGILIVVKSFFTS